MDYKVIITILAGLLLFAAIYIVAQELAKRKVDLTPTLDKVGTGITYAKSVADAINPFLPDIADNVIGAVLDIAQKAVTHVEATYKAALSTGAAACDTRTVEATSLIKSALSLEGIQGTEQIDKLINTIIPLLVLALPKTHETVTPAEQNPAA